jgi:hypothetical protein
LPELIGFTLKTVALSKTLYWQRNWTVKDMLENKLSERAESNHRIHDSQTFRLGTEGTRLVYSYIPSFKWVVTNPSPVLPVVTHNINAPNILRFKNPSWHVANHSYPRGPRLKGYARHYFKIIVVHKMCDVCLF